METVGLHLRHLLYLTASIRHMFSRCLCLVRGFWPHAWRRPLWRSWFSVVALLRVLCFSAWLASLNCVFPFRALLALMRLVALSVLIFAFGSITPAVNSPCLSVPLVLLRSHRALRGYALMLAFIGRVSCRLAFVKLLNFNCGGF